MLPNDGKNISNIQMPFKNPEAYQNYIYQTPAQAVNGLERQYPFMESQASHLQTINQTSYLPYEKRTPGLFPQNQVLMKPYQLSPGIGYANQYYSQQISNYSGYPSNLVQSHNPQFPYAEFQNPNIPYRIPSELQPSSYVFQNPLNYDQQLQYQKSITNIKQRDTYQYDSNEFQSGNIEQAPLLKHSGFDTNTQLQKKIYQGNTEEHMKTETMNLKNQRLNEKNGTIYDELQNEVKKRMLILTNLKNNVTEKDLNGYFIGFSEIEDLKCLKSLKGNLFVIVKFKDSNSVNFFKKHEKLKNFVHEFSSDLVDHLTNDKDDSLAYQPVKRLENPENLARLLCDPTRAIEYFHNIYSNQNLSFYANSIRVREVWVGNLSRNATEEYLKSELNIFGNVEAVDLFNKNQFFAFVKFSTVDSATYCVESHHLVQTKLGQIKVHYSDFFKRFNIVGDSINVVESDSKITNIIFLGVTNGCELPNEKFVKKKFSRFGNVLNILSRMSPCENLRSFLLVQMESKEQAKKIKNYFCIDDPTGYRKGKLGDKRYEINILVKPNVTGSLKEHIAPFLNLEQRQNVIPSSIESMFWYQNDTSGLREETEPVWTGFITKMGKLLTGIDAFMVEGDFHELFDENVFNLNITHKADFSEIQDKNYNGIVRFIPSNETYRTLFMELKYYFIEKGHCGLVRHLQKFILYIVPDIGWLKVRNQAYQFDDIIGIFIKNDEPKQEENPRIE